MDNEPTVRKRRRWPWILMGIVVATFVALYLFLPAILVSISYPTIRVDLAPYLEGQLAGLASNKTAVVDFSLEHSPEGIYVVHAYGTLLDWPFTARVNVTPRFRFFGVDAEGDASVRLDDTPWHLTASFTASSSGDWHVDANMDEMEIDEQDPLLSQILASIPMHAVSNLAFKGTMRFSATAERTAAVPVPKWDATCRISGMDVSCDVGETPISIANLRLGVGAAGVADHVDLKPLHPRADCITATGFTLSNVFAHVFTTELTASNVTRRVLIVTEAAAHCCGGAVRIYSLHLDPEHLNAGVTLTVDGIDTGEALRHVKNFRGEASGRLYGKIPLHMREGRRLRLRSTYLYSVPGEVGKLKVYDPKPVIDNLAMGGVPQTTCDNLSKALADLSYDVFKISLQPEDGDGLALSFKIAGTSKHGNVTVPVTLEVTFHGDIEQLLNTGLGFRTMKPRRGELQ